MVVVSALVLALTVTCFLLGGPVAVRNGKPCKLNKGRFFLRASLIIATLS